MNETRRVDDTISAAILDGSSVARLSRISGGVDYVANHNAVTWLKQVKSIRLPNSNLARHREHGSIKLNVSSVYLLV